MSSKGQDLLLENFVKLVQTARDNNAKEMRLEVCIGQFLTNGNFVPGYNHRFRHVINRLLKRLEKNCEKSQLSLISAWLPPPLSS